MSTISDIRRALIVFKYSGGPDPRAYPTRAMLAMAHRCPYCSSGSITQNWETCTCLFDCHREICGRVGSDEPEYQGSDFPRGEAGIENERDFNDQQRVAREQRAREFQDELKEIGDEAGPGKPL